MLPVVPLLPQRKRLLSNLFDYHDKNRLKKGAVFRLISFLTSIHNFNP